MQRRASLTTSDVACGQKSRRPCGLRRHRAARQRAAPLPRCVSEVLSEAKDALRSIACVAAPCIRPADAGNAAHVDSPTGS